jgi:hypothetical protein
MTQTITVSDVIPATAADIYAAWLDSVAHAAMTGGGKADASPEVGAPHSAWDGYISGMNLALYPGQRIEQSWRSSDFMADDADSMLTVLLDPVGEGTKVTLVHANVPDHQTGYEQGWRDWYLEPMKAYFAALAEPIFRPDEEPSAPKPARRAPRRKPSARTTVARGRGRTARKPAAKRSAARKVPSRSAAGRAGAKKPAAKKPAAKKAPAKKVSASKAAAKRGAVRKKPAAKRPVARRKAGTRSRR